MMQVKEAIKKYKINLEDILLIIMHLRNEKPSIDMVPECMRYETFNIWTVKDVLKNRKDYQKYADFLKQLKHQYDSFDLYSNYYSTDFVLVASSILQPRRIFVMDEGAASIGVVVKRRHDKRHYFKCLIKSLLYTRRIEIPKKICYFSQYALDIDEPDTLEQYIYDKVNNEITIDYKYAIILGQPLSETGLIEENYYLNLLLNVKAKLELKNITRIDYYAHRRESPLKLERINKNGLVIHDNKAPFESIFPSLKPCPTHIYSFSSPILDTLSKKFMKIPEFYVIKIPQEHFLNNNYEISNEVYNVYKKNPRLIVITIHTMGNV